MKDLSLIATLIGFFLGFALASAALAVMYSIDAGGYRAAVRDAALPAPPERLKQAREKELSRPSTKTVIKN